MPSCYSELLRRLTVHCRKEGIKKVIILSLIGFCGREEERGSEKEINKKMIVRGKIFKPIIKCHIKV